VAPGTQDSPDRCFGDVVTQTNQYRRAPWAPPGWVLDNMVPHRQPFVVEWRHVPHDGISGPFPSVSAVAAADDHRAGPNPGAAVPNSRFECSLPGMTIRFVVKQLNCRYQQSLVLIQQGYEPGYI